MVQNLYWGKKVTRDQDFAPAYVREAYPFVSPYKKTPEEYPGWGGIRYDEPCLKVALADGTRDLVLKYVSHQVKGDTLEIRTRDINYDLFVTLVYQVYPPYDIICKHAFIENRTKQAMVLESAQSGVWYVPLGTGYRLTYLAGRCVGEAQLMQEVIQQGRKVLESRGLVTSQQMNPYFALDYKGEANEESGRVWFGALGWSGNWKIVVEQTPDHQVRVTGGYNDFDFGYQLKPGESLTTPEFYGGYSEHGFGEASRHLHHFELAEIVPRQPPPSLNPVFFNSLCADEATEKRYAAMAAKMGVEHFMIDAGWYTPLGGQGGWSKHEGDWYPNPERFPHGLKPLINYVRSLGMEFGLWWEPEEVSVDSNLYRQHPDWVINFPGRPRTATVDLHALKLNLARDDVKDYLFNAMDKLLQENDIKVVKIDMNRHVSEPGWPEVPIAQQKQIWVKYVTNVYDLIDRLRAKHPNLEIESCAGGGGRVDLGILRRTEMFDPSDDNDPLDRLRMWEGYTYAYAPKLIKAGGYDNPTTNGRSTPLAFRMLQGISMGGSFELSDAMEKWSQADLDFTKKIIDYYKAIRRTLQEGDFYRLASPRVGNLTAAEYVAADGKQAVLFAFLHSQQFIFQPPIIYLRGLDERALYRLKPFDDKLAEQQRVLSGSYLMNVGLNFNLAGDFDSTSVLLERVE